MDELNLLDTSFRSRSLFLKIVKFIRGKVFSVNNNFGKITFKYTFKTKISIFKTFLDEWKRRRSN